jgi:hypothetical protein
MIDVTSSFFTIQRKFNFVGACRGLDTYASIQHEMPLYIALHTVILLLFISMIIHIQMNELQK